VVSQQTTPLWLMLGWKQAELKGVLPEWGELMRGDGGEASYAEQFDDAVAQYPSIIGHTRPCSPSRSPACQLAFPGGYSTHD
jgi:hypothetical protein